jgi:hypothetical protein
MKFNVSYFLLILCISCGIKGENFGMETREEKSSILTVKSHLCPDTWVQVQVWCECDGVAVISAVVQYAGR